MRFRTYEVIIDGIVIRYDHDISILSASVSLLNSEVLLLQNKRNFYQLLYGN